MHYYHGGNMQECLSLLIEEKLSLFLIMLKISPNLMGHDFLKEGAKKIIADAEKKYKVGIVLYKEIASDNGVRHDIVDRALRHAIDVSYKRNGIYDFERIMHHRFSIAKPSPRELLCFLAEKAASESRKTLSKYYNIAI